ncbi:MAG: hypothetical protein JKY94_11085 [Rhodobacteraceae bacterium]|nr:hypothetical protein [Paracoccaceae bacterium]
MEDEVLAVVSVSQVRRWLGVGILASIGVMLLYFAFSTSPGFKPQLFLIGVGVAALWLADKMRRATGLWIELTATELRDSTGRLIVKIDDIKSVDAGFLAFKPSNGFLIRSAAGQSRVWRPGLWWRLGKSIGIGGVTPGSQAKAMSQIILMMIATRDHDSQIT